MKLVLALFESLSFYVTQIDLPQTRLQYVGSFHEINSGFIC